MMREAYIRASFTDPSGKVHWIKGSPTSVERTLTRWGISMEQVLAQADPKREVNLTFRRRQPNGRVRVIHVSVAWGWVINERMYKTRDEAEWKARLSRLPDVKSIGTGPQWIAAIRKEIETGRLAPLTSPQAFSQLLCRAYLDQDPWGKLLIDELVLHGNIKTFLQAFAPNHLLVGRGMHGLHLPDADSIWSYIRGSHQHGQEENWSLNVAAASFHFAYLERGKSLFGVRRALGLPPRRDWKSSTKYVGPKMKLKVSQPPPSPVVDPRDTRTAAMADAIREWVGQRGLPLNVGTMTQAFFALQRSVLLVARVPAARVRGFGSDSESGPTHEAEVKTDPCPDCIERVFVLAPDLPGGRPATEEERREWCLSYYDLVDFVSYDYGRHVHTFGKWDVGLVLHADIVCPDAARAVRIRPVRTIEQEMRARGLRRGPGQFRWWVAFER